MTTVLEAETNAPMPPARGNGKKAQEAMPETLPPPAENNGNLTLLTENAPMTPEPPVPNDGVLPAEPNLFEKAVCLALSLRKPGNHRKLSASLVEVDADKDLISAQKTLLSSEHLKTIDHYDGEIRRYLYNHCLPSLFKDGVYLVPMALIPEVEAKLTAFADKRQQLVGAFLDAYPALIEDAQKRLRSAFNPADYPSVERIAPNFRMDWRYVAFSVPGTLKTVSKELFRKEQEKAARQWQEALEEVRTLLRTHLSELVTHLVERLSGEGKDGKPRVFKNTLVTNMTEFLDTFDARNLTDDQELAIVVAQARELLNGVDPQTLRTSAALRITLRDRFCTLQGTLDTLVMAKPARAFSFEEE